MRNDEELRRLIHEAADACLSGVDAMPSRHDAIMHLSLIHIFPAAVDMDFVALKDYLAERLRG